MNLNEQNIRPLAEKENGAADAVAVQVNAAATLPGKQSFDELLKRLFGKNFSLRDNESYERFADYLQRNMEQNQRLVEALEEDPRLAQLLVDVVDGRRTAMGALTRYFGRDMMGVDEDSPEYEEILDAEIERRSEAVEMAENRKSYEHNLERSMPVIDKFCEERGYDKGEFLDRVWQGIVSPILSGSYTAEVCAALDKAMNYDHDVEDAFQAGNVKGRNTNIRQMKDELGDGLPKGMSGSPAGDPAPKYRNSLIEAALKA